MWNSSFKVFKNWLKECNLPQRSHIFCKNRSLGTLNLNWVALKLASSLLTCCSDKYSSVFKLFRELFLQFSVVSAWTADVAFTEHCISMYYNKKPNPWHSQSKSWFLCTWLVKVRKLPAVWFLLSCLQVYAALVKSLLFIQSSSFTW